MNEILAFSGVTWRFVLKQVNLQGKLKSARKKAVVSNLVIQFTN
ncbi:hypothetical protein LEP1GSC035_0816 [Leptospira noguchii str. 2007001578]|uniref:Transposase n=1 Tax=Leptospira noguchii str. 2007001578 TaxID=1049974 RepID=A0ABP2T7T0_9LEPT|nr:hypothetical protein LEP1GSC035_0816 [Leptospira noguchii str. 2007001578]